MITIVSTKVNDVLQDEAGNVIETRLGGPAYYIERIFRQEDFPYQLVTGGQMTVNIVSVPGKSQVGVVRDNGLHQEIPRIITPHVMVSTLYNEWSPNSLSGYNGDIFLDVQGFVRDPVAGFGRKKQWVPPPGLAPLFVKATLMELGYLPPQFVEEQKRHGLIVTRDKFGADIYWRGRHNFIGVDNPIETDDTLGAGDTYFARFAIEFLNTGNPVRAAWLAAEDARKLLEERSK